MVLGYNVLRFKWKSDLIEAIKIFMLFVNATQQKFYISKGFERPTIKQIIIEIDLVF